MSVWSVFLPGITLQAPPKPENMLYFKNEGEIPDQAANSHCRSDVCVKPEFGLPVAAQQSSDPGASSGGHSAKERRMTGSCELLRSAVAAFHHGPRRSEEL